MAVACLQSSVTNEYDCDLYVFLLRATYRHVGSSKLELERLGGRKALATRNRFQPSRSSGRGLSNLRGGNLSCSCVGFTCRTLVSARLAFQFAYFLSCFSDRFDFL